jgi:3-ketosteroid 9alpha-monooxygenase subunit A
MVCFSEELAVGETKPLRYFGRHLAAWRGEDGKARITDAHCPHMGAHLGVNGVVIGNDVACPFHGWQFCGEGSCVSIPYAKKIPPKARVQSWPVHEVNGIVMLYYDAAGGAPSFEIPPIPDYGSPEWLPWTKGRYHVRTHPREIVDNLADKAHFPFVHKTEIDEFSFEVNGHTATQRTKGRALLPNGGADPFSSSTTYHGPGYLLMRMDGQLQNYMLLAHTLVEENELDLWMAVTLKIVGNRERTQGYVAGYLDNLKKGFEDDIRIWENKIYRDPALLCDGDGPIGRLRKWYRQFYVPASEGGVD